MMLWQCITQWEEIAFGISRKRICWIISHPYFVHRNSLLVPEALYNILWHSEFIWRGIDSPASSPQDLRPSPLRLHQTAYSVCSQLNFMPGNSFLDSQPEGATCHGGKRFNMVYPCYKWWMKNICLWIPRWIGSGRIYDRYPEIFLTKSTKIDIRESWKLELPINTILV